MILLANYMYRRDRAVETTATPAAPYMALQELVQF